MTTGPTTPPWLAALKPAIGVLSVNVLVDILYSRLSVAHALQVAEPIAASIDTSINVVQYGAFALIFVLLLRGARAYLWYLFLAVNALLTVEVILGVVSLSLSIGRRPGGGVFLMLDAAIFTFANIGAFGFWYWILERHELSPTPPAERRADLLFPQRGSDLPGWSGWIPGLTDYLWVAFTASTAFGPTDTAVLSQRAKRLMAIQAFISLLIVAVLLSQAISRFGG